MKSLEELDRWIAGKIKVWSSRVAGAPPEREALEIRRAILNDVRDHIEAAGEGRYIFPYNSVAVEITGAASIEGALNPDALEQDVRELLEEAHCRPASEFQIAITVSEPQGAEEAGAELLRVHYGKNETRPKALVPVTRPGASLSVLRGSADPEHFAIVSDRVNIGRLKEVFGAKTALVRRNDIAFAESETSVSREHAWLRYDRETAKFRLFDGASQRGTFIFRGGRRIEVPQGASRGLQLTSGDEIHVGDGRLLFEIKPDPAGEPAE